MVSIEILKKVPFFSVLKDREILAVIPMFKEKKFARNSVIFTQEEEGNTFFFIIDGRVKVVILSRGGREVILAILGKHDFFGEMSLIDDMPRSATLIALEDTSIIFLKREDFLAKLIKYPEMTLRLMQEMSKRIRRADERINSLSALNVYGRVAGVILEIVKASGKTIPEGFLIEKRPTHNDIAGMAGTTRETVSRIMKDLRSRGFLKMDGRGMIVYHAQFDFNNE